MHHGAAEPHPGYDDPGRAPEEVRGDDANARLGHLVIRMVLQGPYENIRNFIYQLESAPEFVIIDDVTLTESRDDAQTLNIVLSTYFRQRRDGA